MKYRTAPLVEASAHLPMREAAERMGVNVRTLERWKAMPDSETAEDVADRAATALGLHPAELWPEWGSDLSAVCEECSGRYVPRQRNQRFCSQPCSRRNRDRAWRRRKRATDPEWAQAKREARRAYYAECGAYERARERRRYQERRAA